MSEVIVRVVAAILAVCFACVVGYVDSVYIKALFCIPMISWIVVMIFGTVWYVKMTCYLVRIGMVKTLVLTFILYVVVLCAITGMTVPEVMYVNAQGDECIYMTVLEEQGMCYKDGDVYYEKLSSVQLSFMKDALDK